MAKRFHPPFYVETAEYEDVGGRPLEWFEWWGPPPTSLGCTRITWTVRDTKEQIISTHNTRKRAEAACRRFNEQHPKP